MSSCCMLAPVIDYKQRWMTLANYYNHMLKLEWFNHSELEL